MFKTVATIRPLVFLLACCLSGYALATDIPFTLSGSSPYCGGTSAKVTYDASAFTFTLGNVFNVELSNPTGNFSSPLVIGTLTSTATTGDIKIDFPISSSGTGFRLRIVSTTPAIVGADNGTDISIIPGTTPTITITADPATTVGTGSVVYFSSATTEGGLFPAYEWKKNGNVVGTSNAIVIPSVAVGDQVVARLTGSIPCSSPATSNIINISVDNNLTRTNHSWEARATQSAGPNPINRSNASGFSIGSKGYIGCGSTGANTYMKDFWEYDPATDVWTQKADLGTVSTPGRYNAIGFSVGTKGYIGTGISATGVLKDLYQYDQTTNTWIQRTDFPGLAREQAFAFSIGNRGYIGGGYASGQDFKDFYEFNTSSNVWAQRADFGGGKRMGSASFAIDAKGFVAGGFSFSSGTWFKDFWDYDQLNNAWTKRADMPGNPRTRATGFALAGNGYVGLGHSFNSYQGQFFQYMVSTDTWSWKPYYPGPSTKTFAVGMSIGNRAFVYKDGSMTEYNLFTTSSFSSMICTSELVPISFDASGFVFGAGNTFTAQISPLPSFSASVTLGTITSNASSGIVNATIPALASGPYYFRITSSNPLMSTMTEMVMITGLPPTHSISSENGASICKGVPVTFSSGLDGPGFQWFKNNLAVGTDDVQYTESSLTNGDVIKCVRTYTSGCSGPVDVTSNTIVMTVREPAKPTINVLAPNILTSSSAVAYQWYLDGNKISKANAQSYLMTGPGTYKVRVSDNAGCFAFSDDVVDVYVGLEDDALATGVSVYPNPASGEIILDINEDLVAKGCNFSVLNNLGQVVIGHQKAVRRNKVDLAGKAPGFYIVRLVVDGAPLVRRIIKLE